jgi:hypothetical protein
MEDILDLYEESYNPEYPVISFDEMSFQMLSDTAAPMPMRPGKPERFDYHYERKGVCNILCAFEPLTGLRMIKISKNRKRMDYAKFIKKVADSYPNAKKIRLVQDNLNTHSGGSFYEAFDAETAHNLCKRIEFHFTPKKASWLNMVEFEFSILSRQCLKRRIGNVMTLFYEVGSYVEERNKAHAQVNWKFSKNKARDSFKRFYKNE